MRSALFEMGHHAMQQSLLSPCLLDSFTIMPGTQFYYSCKGTVKEGMVEDSLRRYWESWAYWYI